MRSFRFSLTHSPFSFSLFFFSIDSFTSERYFGSPWSSGNFIRYEKADLIHKAINFREKNLFIIHGTADGKSICFNSSPFNPFLFLRFLFSWLLLSFQMHNVAQKQRDLCRERANNFTQLLLCSVVEVRFFGLSRSCDWPGDPRDWSKGSRKSWPGPLPVAKIFRDLPNLALASGTPEFGFDLGSSRIRAEAGKNHLCDGEDSGPTFKFTQAVATRRRVTPDRAYFFRIGTMNIISAFLLLSHEHGVLAAWLNEAKFAQKHSTNQVLVSWLKSQ